MGIKISELESTTTANANDVFIINQNGATKKITKENLENQIINPELEERVDVLEEEVEALQNQVTDLEETVNSELEDGTAEGTEITVNDSAVADASLDIGGNTSQNQYDGNNLAIYPYVNATMTANGGIVQTDDGKGKISFNGTATKNCYYNYYPNQDGKRLILEPGNYVVSLTTQAQNITLNASLTGADASTRKTIVSNKETRLQVVEGDEIYIYLAISNGQTINADTYLMINKGTGKLPYEPFVGGQASPSPDYPQDIHILKGSNAIKISNKNKIKISTTNRTLSGVTITNNNNEDVTLNGTATATLGGLSLLSSNTDYPIADLPRNLTFCVKDSLPTGVELAMAYGTSTGGWISNIIVLNSNKKMESISLTNIPSNAEFVRFNFTVQSGTVLNNVVVRPMILDGIYTATTLPEYEPHKEVTKTLTLPNGMEMCKIEDYRDKFVKQGDNWIVPNKILKINSYNGETITTPYISTTGGLDTGATVYYVGNTDLTITDETLISELDELLKLRTYFGQTNITVESGDAKPFMTLNYKKSNRAVTQSELVEIKQAILSLGGNI